MNQSNPLYGLAQEFEAQKVEIAALRESIQSRALEMENVGWTLISGYEQEDDGIELATLKELAEKLRELASTNPWHVRGAQLRHSYVFGRGMEFTDLKPRAQRAVDDPHNREVMFSVDAYEANNLACFTDGNFIVARHETTDHFTPIPLSQIDSVTTDPDDTGAIWYVLRSWSSNGKAKRMWYPVARHKRAGKIRKTIDISGTSVPVSQDTVVYIKRSKRQTGWVWGVPDSLAAMVWTLAYSGYLQDNSKLVHALSQFAWNLTRQTSGGVDKAAAQVVTPGGVGATHVGGPGADIASVGVPSAQVNMNNGQPLIAAVAASFGVPVIALLSSPGATGGSYGAASTLDAPTLKGFEALQDSWKSFYEEIFRDMASAKAQVEFPSIETDAPYRQVTSLAQMVELEILWPDEVRDAALDILDVTKLHDSPPPQTPKTTPGTVVSSQGNSGTLGATTNPGGDTNHDNDASQ